MIIRAIAPNFDHYTRHLLRFKADWRKNRMAGLGGCEICAQRLEVLKFCYIELLLDIAEFVDKLT